MPSTTIQRALISVSNKEGLIPFAKALHQKGIELLSTGGTSQALRQAGIPVIDVADVTGFPEIMDGRVKTLHPKIHGGILGRRDVHASIAKTHAIDFIDLVVVNLYPFEDTIKKQACTVEEAIENIDIGGPAMIRSAAKNMDYVTVVVSPEDYDLVLKAISADGEVPYKERQALALKAFAHTSHYDSCIRDYLTTTIENSNDVFKNKLSFSVTKSFDLRYGENPNQQACAYQWGETHSGLLAAKLHQGKALSYNNLVDADAAIACVEGFKDPTAVIVKHANPCGVASNTNIANAYMNALASDPVSAFGGIVALNRPCDEKTATAMFHVFFEVIIAPAFSNDALQIFSKKPNLRLLELTLPLTRDAFDYKWIEGGLLVQEKMPTSLEGSALQYVTHKKPTTEEMTDLLFAWTAVHHVKSNAILIAKNQQTIGIGAGQVSRIDAVNLAIGKATSSLNQAVLASDAFFPFKDNIDSIAKTGITAIIQPGGSLRDQEVIDACNEYGLAMVLTGVRCFKH